MSFGVQLRSLRVAAGLTQEELAARAGLTPNGVSSLERGVRTRPYPHTVRALADALALDAKQREALLSATAGRSLDPLVLDASVPVPLSDLVGREREVEEIRALLRDPQRRIVTLTGPGGVGKTRLATEVAHLVSPDFAGGIAFLSLAPLAEPALVKSLVARCLVPRDDGESAAPPTLVVLDNFEHLLDAASDVAELLARHPHLTVLVTSRARLRLRGEHEVQVHPLGLPPEADPTPDNVSASASGYLFVERARTVRPDFRLTHATAPEVAALCRRLAGLPLALELAATKIKVLAPTALLERLDEALSAGWARDLPPRQRTLRSTLDWSYDLLGNDDRALLCRLAVFAGGFSLEAAEALSAGPGERVLPVLENLVEQSLITVTTEPDGRTRYALLEPIRQYARDRLLECGQFEDASAEHAAYFLSMAERAAPEYHGRDQVMWLQFTEWETDNLRAAMQWALSNGNGETAARLGWALWQHWWSGGHFEEGRLSMEAALALELPPYARTRALIVLASMCDVLGDEETARRSWTAARENAAAQGDPAGQAWGLAGTGLLTSHKDPARGAELLTEAVSLAESAGEERLASLATLWLGALLMAGGDRKSAVPRFEQTLDWARARGDRVLASTALINLAQAAIADHEDERAEVLLHECVRLAAEMRARATLGFGLVLLGVLAGRRGDWRRSAVLLGAARSMRLARGPRVNSSYRHDQALEASTEQAAASALGAAFGEALEGGQALDLDGAAALALQPVEARSSGSAATPPHSRAFGLSEREVEVLRLVAAGLTNAEVANELTVSLDTVKTHMRNIFGKLDVRDRRQAASRAHKHQLL